jgi:hypothetical protein
MLRTSTLWQERDEVLLRGVVSYISTGLGFQLQEALLVSCCVAFEIVAEWLCGHVVVHFPLWEMNLQGTQEL